MFDIVEFLSCGAFGYNWRRDNNIRMIVLFIPHNQFATTQMNTGNNRAQGIDTPSTATDTTGAE